MQHMMSCADGFCGAGDCPRCYPGRTWDTDDDARRDCDDFDPPDDNGRMDTDAEFGGQEVL